MMETTELESKELKRNVTVDFYTQQLKENTEVALLLVNDGQDLRTMDFAKMFDALTDNERNRKLIVAAIHCGDDRNNEYGMSVGPDFKGWGASARRYEQFILKTLLPFIMHKFQQLHIDEKIFAGFSLGGLSAFDIAWNNPDVFSKIGVFSGSFWWRTVDKTDRSYDPWVHRMMHKQVAESDYREGMKFFFECGELDELEDRNRNGVIDSIDDTLDLMRLLLQKGYREGRDFAYLQLPDGKHDVASWGKAMPSFLQWACKPEKVKALSVKV